MEVMNAPERAESEVTLRELIDCGELQTIMDDFYSLTGCGIGIIDLDGQVLVATGWQDICTRFHRAHPETLKNCLESDLNLSEGAEGGKVKAYKCKNNMWDLMTPIVVDGRRIGNICHGQFFFDTEEIERDCFLQQARQYGFAEADYLAALEQVPIRTKAQVETLMSFYAKMATLVSQLGHTNLLLKKEIKEKQRAQNALTAAEERFHKAFDKIADVVGIIRLSDRCYLEVNDSFSRMLGYERERIIGRTSQEIGLWEKQSEYDAVVEELLGRGSVWQQEASWRTAGGAVRTGSYSADVIELDAEECALFVWHDITKRKEMEEALHLAKEELENKIEQRTQEWRATNQELQKINAELVNTVAQLTRTQVKLVQMEKMAALGDLVAGTAHEINTPLGIGVTLASHLKQNTLKLERDFSGGQLTRSALQDYVAQSVEATSMLELNLERAKRQIENFKLVAVDQAGEIRRVFRLREYIEEILLSLHAKLKKTKHRIEIICEDSYEMDGYPGDFAQVLTNLLMNSLLHAYDGDEAGCIRIEVRKEQDGFELLYADDGKGMSAEVLEKIFDPFFTTKRSAGGSGLGMSIVYNIVTGRMQGGIECSSMPSEGSRFTIKMPALP